MLPREAKNNFAMTTSSTAGGASPQLLFVPSPLTGHLISTVEIARLLIQRNHHLSITILIINLPLDPNANAYTRSLTSSSHNRIRFVVVDTDAAADPSSDSAEKPAHKPMAAVMEQYKPRVRAAVAQLATRSGSDSGARLAGFVIDMFCTSMIDVANEFRIPSYLYYTSGAGFLSLALHVQALRDESGLELSELDPDTEFEVPGFSNPVPLAKVLPWPVIRSKEDSESFVNRIRRLREVKGILVNTFTKLESCAVESLLSSQGRGIPPVYPVGPVLNLKDEHGKGDPTAVMEWLDEQPCESVVFLCFGSMGRFDSEQVKEIAKGLEGTGHRFLWSLQRPPTKDDLRTPSEGNVDFKEVLPEEFLDRTTDIGKVIGWAPQVDILSHSAIGGFVSHCGWNSILESLWFGVPIAAWPIYAEQQANAFTMARELGLAAEIALEYRVDVKLNIALSDVVSSEDVRRGIMCLMGQSNNSVKEKVKALKEESRVALVPGGSSSIWLGRFIEDVMRNMHHAHDR